MSAVTSLINFAAFSVLPPSSVYVQQPPLTYANKGQLLESNITISLADFHLVVVTAFTHHSMETPFQASHLQTTSQHIKTHTNDCMQLNKPKRAVGCSTQAFDITPVLVMNTCLTMRQHMNRAHL